MASTLARESFLNLLHPIQPFKFGIKSLAAKMAIKYKIKLKDLKLEYLKEYIAPIFNFLKFLRVSSSRNLR